MRIYLTMSGGAGGCIKIGCVGFRLFRARLLRAGHSAQTTRAGGRFAPNQLIWEKIFVFKNVEK